jgi:hypothetical protein
MTGTPWWYAGSNEMEVEGQGLSRSPWSNNTVNDPCHGIVAGETTRQRLPSFETEERNTAKLPIIFPF